MLEDIYKKGPLKYPEILQCDNGSEFRGEVTKLLEKHGVKINRSTTKYHHRFTAFVERFNKTLAERLFKTMDAQELEDPEKISTTWVQQLYHTVDILNNEKTAMIGMKPKNAIKLKHVNLVNRKKNTHQKTYYQLMDYTDICIKRVNSTVINVEERLILYGLRIHTISMKLFKMMEIKYCII